MSLVARYLLGIPAAAVGGLVGGPALGYALWKGAGVVATGNPLYLLPGSTLHGDAVTALTDSFDISDGPDPGGDDKWWK